VIDLKTYAIIAVILLLTLTGCAGSASLPETPPASTAPVALPSGAPSEPPFADIPSAQSAASGEVTITFDYQKQSGHASNQFAVWIEDADGGYVKTLYATRFTADGGYKNRPDSIPAWVEKSGLAELSGAQVDAITGATPKSGALSYTWDLTDVDGAPVPAGTYQFFVEGSLRWKNRVLYTGAFEIGGGATTAETEARFIYEASPDQPALTDDAPEHGMIGAVTAAYTP
jgi:hypothetical protein